MLVSGSCYLCIYIFSYGKASQLSSSCDMLMTLSGFGDVFSIIGVREPQAAASEAFVKFADAHRNIEKYGIELLKTIKPVSTQCMF